MLEQITPKFEKIKKKYALNNSYFKNRLPNMPKDPFEVLDYYIDHGELPYKNGEMKEDWFYECFIEYQKRNGVGNSQFFTPPKTAERIAEIVYQHTKVDENDRILDACCGFGQLTMALQKRGFTQIQAFDIDKQLADTCSVLTEIDARCFDYNDDKDMASIFGSQFNLVVSNPPYEVKELTKFLNFIMKHTVINGLSVLLLPLNFIDKRSPKPLAQILDCFEVIYREPMNEKFARTNVSAEIVVLRCN